MCGIVGWLGIGFDEVAADRCLTALSHRGPDGEGSWFDDHEKIVLLHKRLAVIELSDTGHQPMISLSGRYVLVFNGEMYNHREIRQELLPYISDNQWRGSSDTETLLVAIEVWGLEAALTKFFGMFSIALWDRSTRDLYIARDRVGEKPLYYGSQNGIFFFASELKAIKSHPKFRAVINKNSVGLYFQKGYIPAPHSIYQGIKKLIPGTILRVNLRSSTSELIPYPYWSFTNMALDSCNSTFQGGTDELTNSLEVLLKKVVSQQMVADVPVGAFLSGGVDSSLIASIMQASTVKPVKTFTIGFTERQFNEASDAKKIAKYLGTDHTELYVQQADIHSILPSLSRVYDEPFSDSSQIPTLLVSKLARTSVTSALSGDGGDELFGGYNRYLYTKKLWPKLKIVPLGFREFSSLIAKICMPFYKNSGFIKGMGVIDSSNLVDLYLRLINRPDHLDYLLNEYRDSYNDNALNKVNLMKLSDTQKMMIWDAIDYLPNDILVKVDRAAMAFSLETRAPFLDARIVEFAWKLREELKFKNGKGKWILREILNRHLPEDLVNKSKQGFAVPLDSWLRGHLRHWAESLLDEKNIRRQGYLNATVVNKIWTEHLSGKKNWQYQLWDILIFQLWISSEEMS